jgi:hypothetical protein
LLLLLPAAAEVVSADGAFNSVLEFDVELVPKLRSRG